MRILALEFSTFRRSVAVLDDERVIHSVTQEAQRAVSPLQLIAESLDKMRAEEINAIAVGLGPGSYTGIRSSLAIAQGWNLAQNIPCAGISSAEAVAFGAAARGLRGQAEVVIDAQRGEVYSAIYNLTDSSLELVRELKILPRPETTRLIGPEATRWDSEGIIIQPGADALGILAFRRNHFVAPETLEATYLREPSFVKAPAIRHA